MLPETNRARGGLATEPRAPRRYLRYGLIAAITVGLAAASATSAVVGVSRSRNATTALRLSPDDPVALVRSMDSRLSGGDAEAVRSGAVGQRARRALESSPVSASALRLLAVEAEMAGKPKRATALLLESQRLSRRDAGTQFLLLEKRVQQNDIRATLVHYDRLLRTNARSSDILFPILSEAASDPQITRQLAHLLRTEPPWLGKFLDWMIFDARSVDKLGDVLLSVPARTDVWTVDRKRGLIGEFVATGQLDTAFALYRAYAGERATVGLRDGRFQHPSQYPPFEWETAGTPDLEAAITGGGNGLSYRAAGGTGGTAASQLISLKPGRYDFRVLTSFDQAIEQDAKSRWTFVCWGKDGPVLMNLEIETAGQSNGVITVPAAGCGYQWLRLELRPVDNAQGQSGTVREVRLTPVAAM